MNLSQVEVFLVLCEEQHFRQTAERLRVSQSRVSRLIASLEREVGGVLFERSSRRVRMTPLGVRLRDRLGPAHAALLAALDDARRVARGTAGLLRIGFTLTGEEQITRFIHAFEKSFPDCQVELREVSVADPYGPLRRDEIDVLINWLAVDEPDLTGGPAIAHMDRMLAVSATHSLAARTSVSIEELADHQVRANPPDAPRALYEAISPSHTPAGRPIPRSAATEFRSVHEIVADVARGDIVHPTVAVPQFRNHDNITLVPIPDMPPLRLGLIWRTAHENARIRALAEVAKQFSARPGRGERRRNTTGTGKGR